jgi:Protein of unknown function (DUF3618)
MSAGSRSTEEIERELERTRSEIGETLDEIQRQLSPGQLLDQALRYFGEPRQLAMGVGELIMRNPLPVTLIGLGFAGAKGGLGLQRTVCALVLVLSELRPSLLPAAPDTCLC